MGTAITEMERLIVDIDWRIGSAAVDRMAVGIGCWRSTRHCLQTQYWPGFVLAFLCSHLCSGLAEIGKPVEEM